jgi:hypothetical protein
MVSGAVGTPAFALTAASHYSRPNNVSVKLITFFTFPGR